MSASTFEVPTDMIQHDGLRKLAGETLFGNLVIRPDPMDVVGLIGAGLTEKTIVESALDYGLTAPKMGLTLDELDTTLPHFQYLSDILSTTYPDDTLLFAGRDAEVLHDDYAIAHSTSVSYLMPASTDLWISKGMRDKNLATDFLGQYGITRDSVRNPQSRLIVVDSGFHGTIGLSLDERIRRLYGLSLRKHGALAIRLVCAANDAAGQQICDFPGGKQAIRSVKYDNVARRRAKFPRWSSGNTHGLATAMQLMPRYHGTYEDIVRREHRVIALPSADEMNRLNVDSIYPSANDSVVNPVAAAITQYRVVQAALWRTINPNVAPNPEIPQQTEIGALKRTAYLVAKLLSHSSSYPVPY